MYRKICHLILAGLVLASAASAARRGPSRGKPMRPRSGAVNVTPNVTLEWEKGREAVEYDVYFGEDPDPPHKRRQPETTYTPGKLEWGTTYYWRIDEINKGGQRAPGAQVRHFTTRANYEVLENFETYRIVEKGLRPITQSWTVADIDNNGATAPSIELRNVFAGKQSMKVAYNNTGGTRVSVVEHAIPARFRNLRQEGRDSLILFVRAEARNDPPPLFIGLGDEATEQSPVFCPDRYRLNLRNVAEPRWTPWRIPLAAFAERGVNVTDVRRIYISVGTPAGVTFASSEPTIKGLVPAPGPTGNIYVDYIISAGPSFGVLWGTVKQNNVLKPKAKVTLKLKTPASGSFPGANLPDGAYVVLAINGVTYDVTVTADGATYDLKNPVTLWPEPEELPLELP